MASHPDGRMRIAYVHDSPLHKPFETKWNDLGLLSSLGFTDVVVSDQMSGCLGLTLPGAPDDALASLRTRVAQAAENGLESWLMDDLFTLPIELLDSAPACPARDELWQASEQAIRSVLSEIPGVAGLVVRIGEVFDTDRAWEKRANLLHCECIGCAGIDEVERRQMVVQMLERVVCGELGLRCIFRVWDLGEDGMHADAEMQQKVLSVWQGDERFIVSVKHTLTDYWRHQPWNPSIALEGPARLIEFQCEREYEFIGMVPNWQGDEWALGPVECGERGQTGLANVRPQNWAGIFVLPTGGGWAARSASDELWAEMNVAAALALCTNPERDPSDILGEWLESLEFPSRSRSRLHSLLRRSPELILALRYSDVWRKVADQRWMPAENWFRDDTFVPGACARIANEVTTLGLAGELQQERWGCCEMMAEHQTEAWSILVDDAQGASHPKAEFIVSSYSFAARFAEWTATLWDALLEAAEDAEDEGGQLSREQAADIIASRLTSNPIPPLCLLE